MTAFIVPAIVVFILCYGLYKKVDIFKEFTIGVKDGLNTSLNILPSLMGLMLCIGMFKASGGLSLISNLFSGIASLIGLPNELVPLVLIRPLSGSGALAVYEDILKQFGGDNPISILASVIMGSTETTFYTIAIYYGTQKINRTRHTLPCALTGDFLSVILCSILVTLFF